MNEIILAPCDAGYVQSCTGFNKGTLHCYVFIVLHMSCLVFYVMFLFAHSHYGVWLFRSSNSSRVGGKTR
jgi:hypothetical protein